MGGGNSCALDQKTCQEKYPELATSPARCAKLHPIHPSESDVVGYLRYPNVIIKGSTLSQKPAVTSETACAEACNDLEACNGFAFSKPGGANTSCVLKEFRGPVDIPNSAANTGRPGSETEIRRDGQCALYVKQRKIGE
jgi:hypothetical protein